MPEQSRGDKAEKVPRGQMLFDDIWLLMALGLGLPLVSYVVWSVIELAMVPHAP